MATARTPDRTDVIVEVLRDAFAPLMRADPAAFRAKYRKMARDPHAFYRGTACLFFHDVTKEADEWAARHPETIKVIHQENKGHGGAVMAGLRAAEGPRLIETRLAGGRPVLGVCVGMQVMFEGSDEPSEQPVEGLGEWPGTVSRLHAEVVPHMGWSDVRVAEGST